MLYTEYMITEVSELVKRGPGRPSKMEIRSRPENRCSADSKQSGEQCKQPKGMGTPHKGVGNCKYHGGLSISPSERQSIKDNLEGRIQQYLEDPEILDLRREVATLRALTEDFMLDYEESPDLSKEKKDYAAAVVQLIQATVKTTEKLEVIMRKREHVLTVSELKEAQQSFVSVIREELPKIEALVTDHDAFAGHIERLVQRLQTEVKLG